MEAVVQRTDEEPSTLLRSVPSLDRRNASVFVERDRSIKNQESVFILGKEDENFSYVRTLSGENGFVQSKYLCPLESGEQEGIVYDWDLNKRFF
jgi:hypothetical protein